jgi:putative membrane protein
MPMTYAIYGFREALTSALGSDIFIQSVLVLTGCIITFNALLLLVLHLQARKQHNVEEGLNEFAQSL